MIKKKPIGIHKLVVSDANMLEMNRIDGTYIGAFIILTLSVILFYIIYRLNDLEHEMNMRINTLCTHIQGLCTTEDTTEMVSILLGNEKPKRRQPPKKQNPVPPQH